MGNLDRFTRVVKSWVGKLQRQPDTYYSFSEARVLITRLGLDFSPKAYQAITESQVLLEDFLQQLYAGEKETGIKMVTDDLNWNPEIEPSVEEDVDRIAILIKIKGEQKILVEWNIPGVGEIKKPKLPPSALQKKDID